MTYARSRLWLGISGVGSLVVISVTLLATGLPGRLFPSSSGGGLADLWPLLGFVAGFIALMTPLDLIGGYVLPRRFGRSEQGLGGFLLRWARGVATQSLLFVATAMAILWASRAGGLAAALTLIAALTIAYVAMQGLLSSIFIQSAMGDDERLIAACRKVHDWRLGTWDVRVADNGDVGFTGGVVGMPGREIIIVPRVWLEKLSESELASMIARRILAITSGSRLRGIALAMAWNLSGFFLAAMLPNAGTASVAQLVTTLCGFTCWTFIGLLVLPSVSRKATAAVDARVVERGVPEETLSEALTTLDKLQDDEPSRPAMIETIFHPVPSLGNRKYNATDSLGSRDAWHAARMTLFLSWSCLGLLSRAVHCNAGRPELWVMLPTD